MTLTFENILAGQLPDGVSEKGSALSGILRLEKISTPVSALLIAGAQKDDFPNDPAGWMRWAVETTGFDKCEIYHRAQMGKLLLAMRDQVRIYKTLVSLSGDKLLAISRLRPDQIPAFLSQYDVAGMDRSGVRRAVARFLGLDMSDIPDNTSAPELPCFDSALDRLDLATEKELLDDQVAPERVRKFLNAGANLLGAYVMQQSRQPVKDIPTLLKLKQALLDQVTEIESMIAEDIDNGTVQSLSSACTCGDHTAGAADNRFAQPGIPCGAHTGNDNRFAQPGIPCGDHTGNDNGFAHDVPCGNHTDDDNGFAHNVPCGNHTDDDSGFAHDVPCGNHTDDAESETVGDAGAVVIGQSGSTGTSAVFESGAGAADAGTQHPSGGIAGRGTMQGSVPDPFEFRSARQGSADVQQLPQLETVAQAWIDQRRIASGTGAQI